MINRSDPDHVAERIIRDLGIESPEELREIELIAWALGALVREGRLDGAEARLTRLGRHAVITISRQVDDRRRKRFSIAHELGHLELRGRSVPSTWCLREDIENWRRRATADLETQANQFAAALLMPSKMMVRMCTDREASLDLARSVTEVFDTSLTAATIRLVDQTAESVAVIMSQAGRIRWFHGSPAFNDLSGDLGLFIDVRAKLDPRTLAATLFRGLEVPLAYKSTEASAWFTSGRVWPDATVREQSLSLPGQNAVLTMLSVDEEIGMEPTDDSRDLDRDDLNS